MVTGVEHATANEIRDKNLVTELVKKGKFGKIAELARGGNSFAIEALEEDKATVIKKGTANLKKSKKRHSKRIGV
jgi:hypothetical protein